MSKNIVQYLILLFLFVVPLALAENTKISAEVSHTCNISQGFNFSTENQDLVGHLVSMTIDDQTLTSDFVVTNPISYPGTSSIAGVISEIYWGGGITDPVRIYAQVSTNNKSKIAAMLMGTLTSTAVTFKFTIYNYNPLDGYFRCFHTNEITLAGMIEDIGGDLQISIDNVPNGEITTPRNYAFYISIRPQTIIQTLHLATSPTTLIEKQWGEGAVPVELSQFYTEQKRSDVELHWSTATEVNNHGFEVERRRVVESMSLKVVEKTQLLIDSKTQWLKIAFIPGAGTSNSPKEYSFTDATVPSGKYAYRLKQIDNDGMFKYSHSMELEITLPKEFTLFQNYPNPFNPTTTINYTLAQDGVATLKIYNVLGKEVATLVNSEMKAGTMHTVKYDASKLSSGIYFSRLQSGAQNQVKKLILMK